MKAIIPGSRIDQEPCPDPPCCSGGTLTHLNHNCFLSNKFALTRSHSYWPWRQPTGVLYFHAYTSTAFTFLYLDLSSPNVMVSFNVRLWLWNLSPLSTMLFHWKKLFYFPFKTKVFIVIRTKEGWSCLKPAGRWHNVDTRYDWWLLSSKIIFPCWAQVPHNRTLSFVFHFKILFLR